jgi:hypothetical protein
MATNPSTRRLLSRSLFLFMMLLILVGILSGCGVSSTVPTHSTVTTTTSNREIKGAISEYSLPTSHFSPAGIMTGPDGNLWFTEIASNGCQRGVIGRINPTGKINKFSLPSEAWPAAS